MKGARGASANSRGNDGYVLRIRELDSVPKSRRTAINPFFVKGRQRGESRQGLISSLTRSYRMTASEL